MSSNPPPLAFGNYYHIYNRGNNRGNVFLQERNYAYFMSLWWKHTSFIAETYAYCLLKNHFHALVYIKDKEEICPDLAGFQNLPGQDTLKIKPPSQYFSNFLNAYTRGVNIAIGRSGTLFNRTFRRIPVEEERYLMHLIVYIHQNPQKHRFVSDFRKWNYSSYQDLTGESATRIQRDRVLELFGSRDDFIRIHHDIQPPSSLDKDVEMRN